MKRIIVTRSKIYDGLWEAFIEGMYDLKGTGATYKEAVGDLMLLYSEVCGVTIIT